GLQYLHTTIPLPFLKNIYENFCINNNLECTDVKLRKCKKALQCSNKSTSKTQVKNQGTTQENNTVSNPLPLPSPKLPIDTNSSKQNIPDMNIKTKNDSANPFKILNTSPVNNRSISPPAIFGGSLNDKNSSSIGVSNSGYLHINPPQSTHTSEVSETQMPTETPLFNPKFPSNSEPRANIFDRDISKTVSSSNWSSKSNESENNSSASSSRSNIVINDNGGKQATLFMSKDVSPLRLVNFTNITFENIHQNHVYTSGNSSAIKPQTRTVSSILTPIVKPKAETEQSNNNPSSVSIDEPLLKPSEDFHKVESVTTPTSSKLLPSISNVAPFNVTLPSFDALPNPFTLPAPKTTINSSFELPPLNLPSFKPLPDIFTQSTPVTSTSSSDANSSAFSFEPLSDPFSSSMFPLSESS
ncbi:hypothetical protein WA026_007368, partial [Henosepilachna vigintioctopunctata]